MSTSRASMEAANPVRWPSLATGLAIMFGGTLYPALMIDAAGRPDYRVALLLFVAMSAGLVRGVGFVPRGALWAWLFSGWTCAGAIAAAAWLKLFQ